LQVLNLSGNEVSEICRLDRLFNLKELLLSQNILREFKVEFPMKRLKFLSLNDNFLTEISVVNLEGLQELHVDRNRTRQIEGLKNLKFLNTFSTVSQESCN
jgi:Leucine-rich repeat (LRR) protein